MLVMARFAMFIVMLISLVLIMAFFFMGAMIISMKRDAVSVAQVAIGDTDVAPVTRCRHTKTMRRRFSIRVSQGIHLSVLVSMILVMFITVIIVMIVVMPFIVPP